MNTTIIKKIKSLLLRLKIVRVTKDLILAKIFENRIKKLIANEDKSPIRNGKNGTFIFIHINKNGGTSVGKAVGLPKKMHFHVKELINVIGENEFDKAFVFSVIRNPWDRVVSQYRYRVKTNQNNLGKNQISFKKWVKCTYSENKNYFYYDNPRAFATQSEWLKDTKGNIRVDKLIKFESINHDYKVIAKKLGIQDNLPHLNSTKKESYHKYYDSETIEIVRNWFKEDIERFNYSFEI